MRAPSSLPTSTETIVTTILGEDTDWDRVWDAAFVENLTPEESRVIVLESSELSPLDPAVDILRFDGTDQNHDILISARDSDGAGPAMLAAELAIDVELGTHVFADEADHADTLYFSSQGRLHRMSEDGSVVDFGLGFSSPRHYHVSNGPRVVVTPTQGIREVV